MCFGGRGGFKAALFSDGNRDLDGFFEFGGSLAFDVVIASGGLYVMAGANYKKSAGTSELKGYVRAGGTLSVLRLIHASVEFLLSLRYDDDPSRGNSLYGTASVTVSIDVFIVSFDVTIPMEMRLAGSPRRSPTRTPALAPAANGRSAAQAAVEAAPEPPLVYFTRSEDGVDRRRGRFDSARQWNREYWSQFVLPRS
jgi:hypothetical protein